MSSPAMVPIPSDATVGNIAAPPSQDNGAQSATTVPIPADATVGDATQSSVQQPDLRPYVINQRTGQRTTGSDPEGVEKIPSDPEMLKHTIEGAAEGAAVAGGALVPGAVGAFADAAKVPLLKLLAEQSPELFGHEAARETLKRYAIGALQKAVPAAITAIAGTAGYKLTSDVWDDLFGSKKK